MALQDRGVGGGTGFQIMKAVVPVDEVRDAQLVEQVESIRAATQQNVLTVVDFVAILRGREGIGASAEESSPFQEGDLAAGFGEGEGGGDSRNAPADDDRARSACHTSVPKPSQLVAAMLSLRRKGTRARRE